MVRSKPLSLILVALLALPSMSYPQAVNPVSFDVVYLYDVDEGTETFCSLSSPNQPIPVPEKIQAAASLTVTAVSGSPFLNVAVGDQLSVTNSDGTPYRLSVVARASASSITVAGLDSTGVLYTAITLTNASFTYRDLACGTGINDGVIDVSRIRAKVFLGYISVSSLGSGNLRMRIQCRTAPGVPWVQVLPALTPPAVTATYYGWATTVLGVFSGTTIDGYGQCRVGFSLSGTDTGADDLVSVSISGIS
ncbi:MAG: hypothetical protein E6R03_08345 [Hyphomicrobiaceae bacterium]|nr:MAG: hypothetical protein E6R03_08345 [Hyphomicrobiaceae bacterium]